MKLVKVQILVVLEDCCTQVSGPFLRQLLITVQKVRQVSETTICVAGIQPEQVCFPVHYSNAKDICRPEVCHLILI